MDIETGKDDIIKTNNGSMNSRGCPEELNLQHNNAGDIVREDTTTEDDPESLPRVRESESFHLPGEENAILGAQNTLLQQPLPGEVVETFPGVVRVPRIRLQDHQHASQETLSDEGSADPRDSFSGYQIPNDDNAASHMNDGLHVIPVAERVDSTRIARERQLAAMRKNQVVGQSQSLSKILCNVMTRYWMGLVAALVLAVLIALILTFPG